MIRFYHYLSNSRRYKSLSPGTALVSYSVETFLAFYHAQAAPPLHTIQAQVGRLGS